MLQFPIAASSRPLAIGSRDDCGGLLAVSALEVSAMPSAARSANRPARERRALIGTSFGAQRACVVQSYRLRAILSCADDTPGSQPCFACLRAVVQRVVQLWKQALRRRNERK